MSSSRDHYSNSLSTKDVSKLGESISSSPCHILCVIPRCCYQALCYSWIPFDYITNICAPPPGKTGWNGIVAISYSFWKKSTKMTTLITRHHNHGLSSTSVTMERIFLNFFSQRTQEKGQLWPESSVLECWLSKSPVVSLRPRESPGANLCAWVICWPGKAFSPHFMFKANIYFTKRKPWVTPGDIPTNEIWGERSRWERHMCPRLKAIVIAIDHRIQRDSIDSTYLIFVAFIYKHK